MSRLIMIRHGETEWNLQHRYQGHTDIPLNEQGRKQARAIAAYMKKSESIEAVYSSDLMRCRETAGIVAAEFALTVKVEPALRELMFGSWEGLKYEDLYETYADDFQKWFRDPLNCQVPGGESFRQVLDRFLPVIQRIAGQHSGTAAVCSHGGVIRAFINHLDPAYGFWDRTLHPGSVSIFEYEAQGFRVLAAEFLVE